MKRQHLKGMSVATPGSGKEFFIGSHTRAFFYFRLPEPPSGALSLSIRRA
nr:MAG TPA_asm: Retrotransposon hot spot protein [Caudoviricetes sp.]